MGFFYPRNILLGDTDSDLDYRNNLSILSFNRPFRFYQKEKNGKIEYTHQYPAVSVIVYAQNDAENLVKYMPKILNQAYPEFEVIVVNDDSTDDSKDIPIL